MIIGITGLFASGKDTVANYLASKGFDHFSLSAILREEAKEQNIEPTRENLIALGSSLKEYEGHDVLAKKSVEKISGNTVVTSIRHPREVIFFKNKFPDFKLIIVDADPKIRYERAVKRARSGDSIGTFEEFIITENEERGKGGGQEFDEVFKLTDIKINNDGNLDELYQNIDRVIDKLK